MKGMPPVALLAGGLATRMRPLTDATPKALLPVAGEPFIAHQLRLMSRQRISRVVLCVGYRWEMIREFVGDGSRFGLEVLYSIDGPTLLGTGGTVRKALPHLGSEFIVMYGDSWLDTDFAPIVATFHQSDMPALMTVFHNQGKWDTSNVWFEDGKIICYDKRDRVPEMRYIDWGFGILTAELISRYPTDRAFDLADVYSELARAGRLAAYEVTTRFYEIGSPEGLRETEAHLSAQPSGKSC